MLLLLDSGSGAMRTHRAAFLVAMVALADVLCQLAIPVFWSLHNYLQPRDVQACSIAVVNSVGNLGGFAGPAALGYLHDAAEDPRSGWLRVRGHACGPHAAGCGTSRWGSGVAVVGALSLIVTLSTGIAIDALFRGGSASVSKGRARKLLHELGEGQSC